MDAVVSPVASSRKLHDRHELHGRHAEIPQIVEARNNRIESSLPRERTDVKLVENIVAQRQAEPVVIVPGEGPVDDLRRLVDAVGLKTRGWIGTLFPAVEAIEVEASGRYAFELCLMIPLSDALEQRNALFGLDDVDLYTF